MRNRFGIGLLLLAVAAGGCGTMARSEPPDRAETTAPRRAPATQAARPAADAVHPSAAANPQADSQPAADEPRMLVFGVNRVGSAKALYDPPDYDERLYQRIREVGGTCVRLAASPREIEAERGKRRWEEFDRDLGLAVRYGQEPIVCIVNTPGWASPTDEPTYLYPYREELLPEFGDFCTDLARRTRGKVRYFQLWNEQNGCGWNFFDGYNRADEYLPVLKVCYDALKRGNPECVLSLGSLDDAQGHGTIFIRKTYEEQTKQNISGPLFDAVSDHPYGDTPQSVRAKLDAIRTLLEAHGDGEKPFWITEYGWSTRDVSPGEQAARVAAYLKAFTQPAFSEVQAAVYLCIADFEGSVTGRGLCDTNLRPRPAFYAFQGASRFGAYPPFEIKAHFPAADRLAIAWQTLQPTRGAVTLLGPGPSKPMIHSDSVSGTSHRVEFVDLAPATVYRYTIETICEKSGRPKSFRSAEYELRSPGPQVFNGDFDDGFFAGIANGWTIDGQDFCTDAGLIPKTALVHGRHAQAVYAAGGRGNKKLASTLSAIVAAKTGQAIKLSVSWTAQTSGNSCKVLSRIGIAADGKSDPAAAGVRWSNWENTSGSWDDQSVSAMAGNSVVRLFVQCRSESALGDGTATFMLDNVRVTAE